jgi:hypothetical protein
MRAPASFRIANALAAVGATAAVLALAVAVGAADSSEKKYGGGIAAGPAVMSDEEKALVADPNAGMQHGIILLEETDLDESGMKYSELARHVRAKILSNEGRDLANVELPFDSKDGEVVEWWGRTIHDDGRTQELKLEELTRQVTVRARGKEFGVLKGALPGVEPGCVIDYGYVFRDRSRVVSRWRRVPLERDWPLRAFRYRWVPWEYLASGFVVMRAGGLDVQPSRVGVVLNVAARNLPLVKVEPLMPPDDSLRASVSFFYFNKNENQADFWNSEAKKVEVRVKAFLKADKPVGEALARMGLDPGRPLAERLGAIASWISANVRVVEPGVTDGIEAIREDHEELPGDLKRKTAGEVLAAGEGSRVQLGILLIGFARAIGAEADLVLATDRTDHYWEKNIVTMSQFDESLVALRDPARPGDPPILAELGIGLRFGEIPWWVSGATALEATAAGSRDLALPNSEAAANSSESTARISFGEEGGSPSIEWSRKSSGQGGGLDGLVLREKTLEARQKRLDEMCGASDGIDVTKAQAPGLEDPNQTFQIDCGGERQDSRAAGGEYALRFDGPWIAPFPDLPRGPRLLPVIFDYPRIDRLELDVSAPPGFKAGSPPPPIRAEGPFGAYTLAVTATPAGYHVERSLSVIRPKIDPPAYRGLEKFLGDARAADRRPLVFVRAAAGGR